MSTNRTANLGLSQWTATDPVIRTDFNSDNQKLDTAIAALQQMPYVKLMEVNVPSNVNMLEVNLSSIDLTQYAALEFMGQMYYQNSSNNCLAARFNGISSNVYYSLTIRNPNANSESNTFMRLGRIGATEQSTSWNVRICLTQQTPTVFSMTSWVDSSYGLSCDYYIASILSGNITLAGLNTINFFTVTNISPVTTNGIAAGSGFKIYGIKK